MKSSLECAVVIKKENDLYVSLCPQFDIASLGETPEKAKLNLMEALELFFETASETEMAERLRNEL